MRLHILGICGTFMGGLARLAKASGHQVTGSDADVYPPMSEQLHTAGITIHPGYQPEAIPKDVDQVIIGNALSRANPAVEYVLDNDIPYISGPQWLAENILRNRHVLAVSGTHGKTTTASILAWLLEANGKKPGFLIGGVAENFGVSARLGESGLFVIEADEYDSAFFDKRSKFIHYKPKTLIITNIDFDHADIFRDLDSILDQFHHLVRIVPANGQIIINTDMRPCLRLLERGSWSRLISFGESADEWCLAEANAEYSAFTVQHQLRSVAEVSWPLLGSHNALNALAAMIAARQVGVTPASAAVALAGFKGVKRRLQKLAVIKGVHLYDDFAHHPTAIRLTLQALRAHISGGRIIAVLEPRSNTMKMGRHRHTLAAALEGADCICVYQPANLGWDLSEAMNGIQHKCSIHADVQEIIDALQLTLRTNDHVIIMSNGSFDNLHQRLLESL